MTDSYYLINDQIKFYFDIENLCIEYNGQHQALEPKEARILKYVLENQVDGLIKSESILDDNWDYWSDKKVLQKVLSTLRKKFKNIGVTENGFVAADSNYKINYNAVLVNETHKPKSSGQWFGKALSYAKTAVLIGAAVLLTMFVISKLEDGPKFTVGHIIQSTTIGGVSVEPAVSADGTALAFTHKKGEQSQIYVKLDANLNYQVLTKGPYDQVPSWSPSGQQLAFQKMGPKNCEIRLIRLDEHYNKVGGEETLAKCNPLTRLMSITWKDENTLFFTEAKSTFAYSEIMQLDVNSKKVTPYYTFDESEFGGTLEGSGHYFIVYNRKLDSLFSLQSPDWQIATINRVNNDNTSTMLRKVGSVILSFDVFENQVIFKDLDNQLKSFDIDNPQELTTIYRYPLKSIAYPVVSASSNKIALVSGSVFKNSIHTYSFKDGKRADVFNSDTLIRHPQEFNGEILYLSAETGIGQIYAYEKGVKTQITNFKRNHNIVYFTMSNNKKWMAISFSDQTTIYERSETGLTELKTFPTASEPSFSRNSERILLTNWVSSNDTDAQGMEKALVEYYVNDFSETGITIRNAKFGVYHKNGIIFPTWDNKLMLFKLDGIDTIVEDLRVSSRSVVGTTDDSFIVSFNTRPSPVKINLDSYEMTELNVPIRGQIAVNNEFIYFKERQSGSMVIFKGELTEQ